MSDRHFFLVNPADITGDEFFLNSDETKHLRNVLRLKPGSEIWLTDGAGMAYSGLLSRFEKDQSMGIIKERFPELGEVPVTLDLAIGIIKRDNLELAIEKAVELEVNSITPIIMDHCIKRTVRIDRLEKQVLAAVKQCGRSRLPVVNEPVTLAEWIKQSDPMDIIVCHPSGQVTVSNWYQNRPVSRKNISVLVGPEGDFSTRELKLLTDVGVSFAKLGNRRLRSETAVITAMAVLNELIITRGIGNE